MFPSDQDIVYFLKTLYFNDFSDIFKASSDKAYQDFCRTIRVEGFKGKSDIQKEESRTYVTDYLKKRITGADDELNSIVDQKSFDIWHTKTCNRIIEEFLPCAKLNYGQAQKWLNMTCKYLCVFEEPHVKTIFPWLHAPIDTIVFERATELNVHNTSKKAWSNWNEEDYKDYQNRLREAIKKDKGEEYPVLLWEWQNWKPKKA